MLKRNIDKKFINPIYFKSDIPILSKWILITNYDTKIGLSWLDKRIVFKSIKNILKGIYLDIKKGI